MLSIKIGLTKSLLLKVTFPESKSCLKKVSSLFPRSFRIDDLHQIRPSAALRRVAIPVLGLPDWWNQHGKRCFPERSRIFTIISQFSISQNKPSFSVRLAKIVVMFFALLHSQKQKWSLVFTNEILKFYSSFKNDLSQSFSLSNKTVNSPKQPILPLNCSDKTLFSPCFLGANLVKCHTSYRNNFRGRSPDRRNSFFYSQNQNSRSNS